LIGLSLAPILTLWLSDAVMGVKPSLERLGGRVMVVLMPCFLAFWVAYNTGSQQGLLWVGIATVVATWLIALTVVSGPYRMALHVSKRGLIFPPLGLLAATICLLVADASVVATVCTGAALYVVALAMPYAVGASGDGVSRFGTALAAPVMVLPMYYNWQWIAPDFGGLLALLMGAAAVLGVAAAGSEWMDLEEDERRTAQSVYLVVALFFASLAVPLQLEKEWLTVGWAIEGAVLAWASRSIRQPVVVLASVGLLATVAVRLVVNPAVMTYHLVDSPTVWNWILYGYGVPVAAFFAASRWLRLPVGWKDEWLVLRGLELGGLAVLFAMLNLQVSHAFVHDGALSFYDVTVHAQLARTLSWTVFALGMLGAGFADRQAVRWLGVGLFTLVVAKILFFDLWVLRGLGRVLLLLGVGPLFFTAAGILQMPRRAGKEIRA